MMKYNYKLIFFLILLMESLSQNVFAECIEPDDFGFFSIDISPSYEKEDIFGTRENQQAKWISTKRRVNGSPMLIKVKYWDHSYGNNAESLSAWTPWYGDKKNKTTLPPFYKHLPICQLDKSLEEAEVNPNGISNMPCVFNKGVGLYGLIAKNDPNQNQSIMRNPPGLTFHVGKNSMPGQQAQEPIYDTTPEGTQVETGGLLYDYDIGPFGSQSELKNIYKGSKLYFKILDSFYEDNAGKYKMIIKSGLENSTIGPVYAVINLIKITLFGASAITKDTNVIGNINFIDNGQNSNSQQNISQGGLNIITHLILSFGNNDENNKGIIPIMFNKIISNSNFKFLINTMLILYVAVAAMQFLTGNIEYSQGELIKRIIKMVLVSQLIISPDAWTFFYDYLFVYFIHSADFISGIMTSSISSGRGGLLLFDDMIGIFLSTSVFKKLISLILFGQWGIGILFVIVFCGIAYFVGILILRTVTIYLVAFMIISLLIVLGPLFISFMLFGFLAKFFQHWIKILISYVIQMILIIAGFSFMALTITTNLQKSLGFQVCYKDLLSIPLPSISVSEGVSIKDYKILGWYVPTPGPSSLWLTNGRGSSSILNSQDSIKNIYAPDAHMRPDGSFCPAYACKEKRYSMLPYLSPDSPSDRVIAGEFARGRFVQWRLLLVMSAIVWVMFKFNNFVIGIGRIIANTDSFANGALGAVSKSAYGGLSDGYAALRNIMKAKSANDINALKQKRAGAINSDFDNLKKQQAQTAQNSDNSTASRYQQPSEPDNKVSNANLTNSQSDLQIISRDNLTKAEKNKLAISAEQYADKYMQQKYGNEWDKLVNSKSAASLETALEQIYERRNQLHGAKDKTSEEFDLEFERRINEIKATDIQGFVSELAYDNEYQNLSTRQKRDVARLCDNLKDNRKNGTNETSSTAIGVGLNAARGVKRLAPRVFNDLAAKFSGQESEGISTHSGSVARELTGGRAEPIKPYRVDIKVEELALLRKEHQMRTEYKNVAKERYNTTGIATKK